MRLIFSLLLCLVTTIFSHAQWQGTNPVYFTSGNVGIGTSTPDHNLHIKDTNFGNQLKFERGTGIARILQDNNTNNLYLEAPAGLMLNYYGGNVGIGTQHPDHKLHIKDGPGGSQLKFQRGTGVTRILQDDNANNLYLEAPAGLMLNYYGGNVGIGTQNPDHRLHIKDGPLGAQLKFQRGTGTARVLQDNNANNLYLEAPAGLMLNYYGGNVGIGTQNPDHKLHIKDGTGGNQLKLQRGTGVVRFVQNTDKDDLYLLNNDASKIYMYWKYDGNVGIGTNNPGSFKLAVEGKVGAREVVVTSQTTWPDYVFEPNYNLPSLSELEQYIKTNKHLPEVPTASEVKENGLSLGEMNAILLKKVEELTLHLIEQDKKINELMKERKQD